MIEKACPNCLGYGELRSHEDDGAVQCVMCLGSGSIWVDPDSDTDRVESCPACEGTGDSHNGIDECFTCGGTGEVDVRGTATSEDEEI